MPKKLSAPDKQPVRTVGVIWLSASDIFASSRRRRAGGARPCSALKFPSPVRKVSGQFPLIAQTGLCEPSIWRRKNAWLRRGWS